MSQTRRRMSLDLRSFAVGDAVPNAARPLVPAHAPALGRLMFDAYRGTIDDEGEPLEGALAEVQRTFEGAYGSMMWEASFVAPVGADGLLPSASVVTFWEGAPLLAFSMTRPEAQRQGLAAQLIRASAGALLQRGHERLLLVVTAGNTPAERLYEKLGFLDVPRA